MLDCSQFLEDYSEYRDDRLEPPHRAAFEEHLAECVSCARYHRVVERGVQLFCELPRLSPSHDFQPRLQHRIFHLQDEMTRAGVSPSGATAAVTFVIAALLTAAAWIPLLQRPAPALRLPPVAAAVPVGDAAPSLFQPAPLLVDGAVRVHTPALIASDGGLQHFPQPAFLPQASTVVSVRQAFFPR